jgi:glycosyltransferase involved in cell wall biosynthesis
VIETKNLELGPELALPEVIAGLKRQSYPAENIEIIIVVNALNLALIALVRESWPEVRLVETAETDYYVMKNVGAGHAGGDIIVMLDSDCIPSPIWVESFVARIQAGADAVGGKTRYDSRHFLSRTFNFFNFGYIQGDSSGTANSTLPNNVAYKREVFQRHPFEQRLRRSGAAHLLCQVLKAHGYRVVYEPAMFVTHNSYGVGEELHMRVKAGYDTVNLANYDTEGVLQEAKYRPAGKTGLFIVFLNRIVFDVRAAIKNRKDLDLSIIHIPYFLVVSPVIRGVELVSGLITTVRPQYFRDKFGW